MRFERGGSVRAECSSVFARCGLAIALVASMAACSTTGRPFDTADMSQIIPGQTTLEQAIVLLKGQPENVYRQRDGSAMARWAHKATMVTDAVYFRRELWLQFGSDGRFQEVVEQVNVQGEPGQQPATPSADVATPFVHPSTNYPSEPTQSASSAAASDMLDGSLPRTVPTGFPYSRDAFQGPTVVYPVR